MIGEEVKSSRGGSEPVNLFKGGHNDVAVFLKCRTPLLGCRETTKVKCEWDVAPFLVRQGEILTITCVTIPDQCVSDTSLNMQSRCVLSRYESVSRLASADFYMLIAFSSFSYQSKMSKFKSTVSQFCALYSCLVASFHELMQGRLEFGGDCYTSLNLLHGALKFL